MKVNIAIDGPSGAGKSTISKELAKRLGYTFINSGSVYRAIAYNANKKGIESHDTVNIIDSLEKGMIKLMPNDITLLRGVDISHDIRADYISKITPTVAKIPEVREFAVDFIQHMTRKHKGYIIDGRDTTFKIMPHAEVKIFLWASEEERARRRLEQNQALGYNTNFEEVLYEVKLRDAQDMNRAIDPLHKTADAILVDCTEMTPEEVINHILDIVANKIKQLEGNK
ncbi:(d)CMP kinase [Mycoplasmopsis verecunda]|uniref:Cytidylate kinase n=1 Tax=Mycoplasmopsis verecunda TaxID=171291 RepID=A0A1T4LIX4_9BACT|nr:(d)CMP kinase [Mycoplasmopsis verecunda]WPB54416.1 (d)CMP kinase [Mycoplasmopsis verecunda]SJZ54675.1 cytidylate kinase [Mycoplasmopsis verecunda]